MKKLLKIFLVLVLFSFNYSLLTIHYSLPIWADEIEEIQKQINDLARQLELSKNATTPLESQVKDLETQLASISARLFAVQKDLETSEDDLEPQKVLH